MHDNPLSIGTKNVFKIGFLGTDWVVTSVGWVVKLSEVVGWVAVKIEEVIDASDELVTSYAFITGTVVEVQNNHPTICNIINTKKE